MAQSEAVYAVLNGGIWIGRPEGSRWMFGAGRREKMWTAAGITAMMSATLFWRLIFC